jgi:hypothetical protein
LASGLSSDRSSTLSPPSGLSSDLAPTIFDASLDVSTTMPPKPDDGSSVPPSSPPASSYQWSIFLPSVSNPSLVASQFCKNIRSWLFLQEQLRDLGFVEHPDVAFLVRGRGWTGRGRSADWQGQKRTKVLIQVLQAVVSLKSI